MDLGLARILVPLGIQITELGSSFRYKAGKGDKC